MELNVSRQILKGNLLLVVCCIFYLIWWLLAFRPSSPLKGFRSGWLLIPAAASGIAGVLFAVKGCKAVPDSAVLFSLRTLAIVGVAVYFLLLLITGIVFHRAVTTELVLIVGWTVLMLAEISTVYGAGILGHTQAFALMAAAVMVGFASLICYLLYYHLDKTAGYLDGILPLAFVSIDMIFTSVLIK